MHADLVEFRTHWPGLRGDSLWGSVNRDGEEVVGERAGAGHPWVSHTGVGEPRDGKGKGRPHTHGGAGEAGAPGALHGDERGSPVGLRGPHRLPLQTRPRAGGREFELEERTYRCSYLITFA